jgi:hypothetical protein
MVLYVELQPIQRAIHETRLNPEGNVRNTLALIGVLLMYGKIENETTRYIIENTRIKRGILGVPGIAGNNESRHNDRYHSTPGVSLAGR